MRAHATGRVLTDTRGRSFRFDAGAVCLDFAHSGGEGEWAVFETLHEPDDLATWLSQPPLTAAVSVPITAGELAEAKTLRQAIWEIASRQAAGEPVPRGPLAAVNRAAARPPLVPRLDADGTLEWARPVHVSQALSTIAREFIELLSGPLAGRIRECASDDCPLVFVDSSRPGARRWCAMERCGNRQKLRAMRARRQADRP
jgi:predicted RNA-binding Zn ribbon-like protein